LRLSVAVTTEAQRTATDWEVNRAPTKFLAVLCALCVLRASVVNLIRNPLHTSAIIV